MTPPDTGPEIVFAAYRPKEGKANDLGELLKDHLPTLKRLELITDRAPIVCRAKDGTIIEVFEWRAADSSAQAHEHPEVAKIWEAMGEICDLPPLTEIAELAKRFPHFSPVNI